MLRAESLDICWKFIRGDYPVSDFESWLYENYEFEQCFSKEDYLDLISTDFNNQFQLKELKDNLERGIQKYSHFDCNCHSFSNLQDLELADHRATSIKRDRKHSDEIWWLRIAQCETCKQDWLWAQDTRINDATFISRVTKEDAERVKKENEWPRDFLKFSYLLELGIMKGHRCRFLEIYSPSLLFTTEDLAVERPGISVQEIARLLQIDIEWAKRLAQKVLQTKRVEITI